MGLTVAMWADTEMVAYAPPRYLTRLTPMRAWHTQTLCYSGSVHTTPRRVCRLPPLAA